MVSKCSILFTDFRKDKAYQKGTFCSLPLGMMNVEGGAWCKGLVMIGRWLKVVSDEEVEESGGGSGERSTHPIGQY